MKVLMINKFLYPNGGSETYIFKLGEHLEEMGHVVQYFGMLVSFVYFVSVPFWGGEYKANAIIEWMYILSVGLDISWKI